MGKPWRSWLLPTRVKKEIQPLKTISAARLRVWMSAGDTLLIDIREAEEHARGCIPGAVSLPLSRYPSSLAADAQIRRVVFHCQSGNRTRLAARRLKEGTTLPACALESGLSDWDES